ncbi:hypothetical protein OH805_25225 [Streptomyces sp. NBC_00879]|uniref:hypothetical protein n=1 Tax=Streptomyces sp. TaxID=1931 RepID=UPI002D77AE55|nr:hypothetical protein [Streptomyces sp.]WSY69758.1 hypothetical protein OHA61_26470 [Streptomyces sp. NBC_00885]WSY77169.1 hypothetical protein OH805_25225 [Streptomyces sp. NBC_00879]HET6354789.1 hypothetical protein [Streptomyces sp.]
MASKENPRHSMECIEEAEEAVNNLRTALERYGITLPSLRLEPASYAREAPCPLVELGRCTVDVVRMLTAVLPKEGGAAR